MFDTRISLYGIMIILSLLANVIVVVNIYKKFDFNKYEIISALVYENIGIIFGAKLLTYLQSYRTTPKFEFLKLGLSSYGAVIGAIICLIIYGLQFKKSIKDMLFSFMPSIPLMYAIGKIGCFLVGCCYGFEYNGIGNIVYKYSKVAPSEVHLFPVQLLETIVFMFIFVYMINKILKDRFYWKTFGISFILCGMAKFVLDYFRMSHVNVLLSLNQLISLVFMFIGLVIYLKTRNKTD